ncbi:uncharacterized protein METZ01_LOCUS299517 [marine metagenome]|uniref:Uncharacterized protein n=1 Tax=marine metagenome TaxID=408172 RepID=A0A382MCD7_9ZZZZ
MKRILVLISNIFWTKLLDAHRMH